MTHEGVQWFSFSTAFSAFRFSVRSVPAAVCFGHGQGLPQPWFCHFQLQGCHQQQRTHYLDQKPHHSHGSEKFRYWLSNQKKSVPSISTKRRYHFGQFIGLFIQFHMTKKSRWYIALPKYFSMTQFWKYVAWSAGNLQCSLFRAIFNTWGSMQIGKLSSGFSAIGNWLTESVGSSTKIKTLSSTSTSKVCANLLSRAIGAFLHCNAFRHNSISIFDDRIPNHLRQMSL